MNKADRYMLDNIQKILSTGTYDVNPRGRYKSDGAPAHSKFITHVYEEYDLERGEFPIPSITPTAKKSGVEEVLWIYQDQSNVLADLKARGVHWWDDWDIGDGTIGQRYGATVKKYNLMNQLLLDLERNPFSRRHMINLWQVADFQETEGLVPCAFMTEWSVRKRNELSDDKFFLDMHLHQRSNDYLMAGYINKVQYVALQMMVAGHLRTRGMDIRVGKFSHFVNNLHIYNRHIDVGVELSSRIPYDQEPEMILLEDKVFNDYKADDIFFLDANFQKRVKWLDIAI